MDCALSTIAASAAAPSPARCRNLLLLVAALVFAMVVVGGITRLTESGLSITEWKPISGAIPPLTHADWVHAFDLYQATPEYRRSTGPAGMTLAQFKFIFFWEWVHRLLGRLIGLVFALPAALVRAEARDPQRLWLEAGRPARASAGLQGAARLVHGDVGPVAAHRRQPFPPVRAPAARAVRS